MLDQNVIKLTFANPEQRQRRLRKTKAELVEELESLEARFSDFQDASQTPGDIPGLGHGIDRFKAIVDNIPIGISLKDKDGRVVLANRQILEWWGISEEEALGQTTDAITGDPEEVILTRRKHEQEAWEKQEISSRDQRDKPKPDGSHRYITITKIPIIEEDGKTSLLCTTIQDITRYKQIESNLSTSEARFRTALEFMTGGLFMFS